MTTLQLNKVPKKDCRQQWHLHGPLQKKCRHLERQYIQPNKICQRPLISSRMTKMEANHQYKSSKIQKISCQLSWHPISIKGHEKAEIFLKIRIQHTRFLVSPRFSLGKHLQAKSTPIITSESARLQNSCIFSPLNSNKRAPYISCIPNHPTLHTLNG